MPAGTTTTRTARRDRFHDEAIGRWAVPVFSVGGTRLIVSYVVFIAAAILVGIVLSRGGKSDLPGAAAMGAAFWMSGWLVQATTYLTLASAFRLPRRTLRIGLLGVESVPCVWPALRSLLIALGTVTSLVVLGSFYRWVEGGFQMPVLSRSSSEFWVAPSVGFTSSDSMWKSAAWLCWVQAVFQMYPLPRTMGRQMVGALAGLCGRRLSLDVQVSLFRRCLIAMAIVTMVLTIFMMRSDDPRIASKWPLLFLAGMLLWLSSRSEDVSGSLVMFQTLPDESTPNEQLATTSGPRLIARIRQAIAGCRQRRRVRQAMDRERGEATDVRRLDEILNRLHQQGVDSLSQQDRKILERVSENLRKQRESASDAE